MAGGKVILLVTLGFALIGLVFLGISFGLSGSVNHKKKVCTQQVVAQVVDMKQVTRRDIDRKRSTSWYPVYEYFDGSQTIRVRSHIGGMESSFQIGQKVVLKINPENTQEFYNPDDQSNLLRVVFLIVGMVLIVAAAGVFLVGRMI